MAKFKDPYAVLENANNERYYDKLSSFLSKRFEDATLTLLCTTQRYPSGSAAVLDSAGRTVLLAYDADSDKFMVDRQTINRTFLGNVILELEQAGMYIGEPTTQETLRSWESLQDMLREIRSGQDTGAARQ